MKFPADISAVQKQLAEAQQAGNDAEAIACMNAIEMTKTANLLYLQSCAGLPNKKFLSMSASHFAQEYLADRENGDALPLTGQDGEANMQFATDWLQVFCDAIKQGIIERQINLGK